MHVGFIGLGIMGQPMAGHLLKAGYPLTVYNRTRSKTQELAGQGASVAESPAQAARKADVVITIVSDSPDVSQVIEGPQGVLEGISSGAAVIDMSTVSPALEQRLDGLLRDKGASLIDAPVSGGDVGARWQAVLLLGGRDEGGAHLRRRDRRYHPRRAWETAGASHL